MCEASVDLGLEAVLVSLDVFSKLEVGDTLTWCGAKSVTPNIQKYGPFQGFRRHYNGDNRLITVHKVQEVISLAITLSNDADSNRIRMHLLAAVAGLRNLQKTYTHDTNVVSTLQLSIEDASLKLSS